VGSAAAMETGVCARVFFSHSSSSSSSHFALWATPFLDFQTGKGNGSLCSLFFVFFALVRFHFLTSFLLWQSSPSTIVHFLLPPSSFSPCLSLAALTLIPQKVCSFSRSPFPLLPFSRLFSRAIRFLQASPCQQRLKKKRRASCPDLLMDVVFPRAGRFSSPLAFCSPSFPFPRSPLPLSMHNPKDLVLGPATVWSSTTMWCTSSVVRHPSRLPTQPSHPSNSP